MRVILFLIFIYSFSVSAQQSIQVDFLEKWPIDTDQIVSINQFKNIYSIDDNVIQLGSNLGLLEYSNVQLGTITSANAFNPLKVNLFYKDFNSVVILDNRLAEITKLDFNALTPFRLITFVSTGNDNTIWIYNQNTQQIELFDYLTLKTRIVSLPISGEPLDLISNYNFCWLLTEDEILTYNYFGSLLEKLPNDGFTKIINSQENLFLLKENKLYFKAENSNTILPIDHPELLIKQFLVTNETLYIYDGEVLHHFRIKFN